MIADPIHQQAQRELIVALLRAYGVEKNLSGFDNKALKVELERVFWGETRK